MCWTIKFSRLSAGMMLAFSIENTLLCEFPFNQAIDNTDQITTPAINTFNNYLTFYKNCRDKQMYVWESIDAIAQSSLSNNENDYWLSLEIAVGLNVIVVAHGLAKKFIRQYVKNNSVADLQQFIQIFSPAAQELVRKEFFLMTGNAQVMTYADQQGQLHTPSFMYQELFFEKQFLIDNARMVFNNRFLRSIDGISSPVIYYVDRLEFQHNYLTSLPDSFATISTAKILDLSFNRFTTFPPVICKLPNLEILNLNNNQLATLPSTLNELKNLYRLDVGNNLLTEIPSNIFQFPNLHALDLSNNKLSKLPSTIPSTCKLEKLILSGNQFTELPCALAQIATLRILNIKNNPLLRSLPAAFKRIPRIEKDDHVVFAEQ